MSSERTGLRAAIVLVVIGVAGYVNVTQPIRLGLDLRGGTQIVLEARDTEQITVDAEVTDRTLEVLRRRIDALGVAEPSLQRSGEQRIIVELPGLDDPEQAIEVIGRTAQLTFHGVLGAGDVTGDPGELPDGVQRVTTEDGEVLDLAPAVVTGADVSDAMALTDPIGGWRINIEFRGGGESWAELTGEAACAPPGDPRRRVAVMLDDQVIMSPQVEPSVACGVGLTGGDTVVTGQYTESEAKDLALLVRAGALPVPVDILEQRTVGPTLGRAAIDASVEASIIGIVLTAIFIVAYYRLLGAVATVALGIYALVSLAALQAIGATLTLPGIAGFVLAVGMAVDGNVLVFERVKEEDAEGRSLPSALRHGFHRAWTAIIDSNVTTLLAAGLLFMFASGGVRGFGVTLAIGVVVSMFTSLVVTRVLLELLGRVSWLRSRRGLWGLEVGRPLRARLLERNPAIIGRARLWFGASGLLVAVCLAGIVTQGLNYGLDFTGGRLVEYTSADEIDVETVRRDLGEAGFPRSIVNRTGDGNVVVRTRTLDADEVGRVDDAVTESLVDPARVREEIVGPTIGAELRQRALWVLGIALAAQLLYLMVRFRWSYATAAVLGLAHNVIILVGVFAWLGKDFDGVFVAALLAVIGYSTNDTIVIFDRIRERFGLRPDEPLRQVANDALLETLPRTVNTGLSSLFVLFALWLLAGDTLADFALALIIGILVGMYCSVFVSAPIGVLIDPGQTARPLTSRAAPSPRPGRVEQPVVTAAPRVLPAPARTHPPRPRKQKRRGGR